MSEFDLSEQPQPITEQDAIVVDCEFACPTKMPDMVRHMRIAKIHELLSEISQDYQQELGDVLINAREAHRPAEGDTNTVFDMLDDALDHLYERGTFVEYLEEAHISHRDEDIANLCREVASMLLAYEQSVTKGFAKEIDKRIYSIFTSEPGHLLCEGSEVSNKTGRLICGGAIFALKSLIAYTDEEAEMLVIPSEDRLRKFIDPAYHGIEVDDLDDDY